MRSSMATLLHELIARSASHAPASPALVAGTSGLTYEALAEGRCRRWSVSGNSVYAAASALHFTWKSAPRRWRRPSARPAPAASSFRSTFVETGPGRLHIARLQRAHTRPPVSGSSLAPALAECPDLRRRSPSAPRSGRSGRRAAVRCLGRRAGVASRHAQAGGHRYRHGGHTLYLRQHRETRAWCCPTAIWSPGRRASRSTWRTMPAIAYCPRCRSASMPASASSPPLSTSGPA